MSADAISAARSDARGAPPWELVLLGLTAPTLALIPLHIHRAFGLPVHPLLLHVPVILVPIAGLAALAVAAIFFVIRTRAPRSEAGLGRSRRAAAVQRRAAVRAAGLRLGESQRRLSRFGGSRRTLVAHPRQQGGATMKPRIRKIAVIVGATALVSAAAGCGAASSNNNAATTSAASASAPTADQQPDLSALAAKLGVSTSALEKAMQSIRPDRSSSSTPQDMAAALAKALGISESKVQAAMQAVGPAGGQPPSGSTPPSSSSASAS